MIDKKVHIPELYELKHVNDSDTHTGFNYEEKLFSKLFSNLMFGNKKMNYFFPLLQQNAVWMIESVLPIRNWWNYTVDKYYDKHNN